MPRAKAQAAGETPKEICTVVSLVSLLHSMRVQLRLYQISERVQLGTHQTALLPPSRNHAVEEVEEEAERHESQSRPNVARVMWMS